jgi:hypothetical protein
MAGIILIGLFLAACGNVDGDDSTITDAGSDTDTDTDTEPDMEFPCSWKLMNSGTDNILHGIWGSSPEDVFAVGDDGTILHYDGVSWTQMESGTDEWLTDVGGLSSMEVYAVSPYLDSILRYDGLLQWKQLGMDKNRSILFRNDVSHRLGKLF